MSVIPAWNGPRTAIVTGGGSGIGRSISLRLGLEGASVAVFDRNADTATATAEMITAAGGTAIGLAVDVADRASIEAGVAETAGRFGPATILVNNAGITPFGKFLDIGRDEYEAVMAVNVRGTWDCCQVVVPGMVAARWGRIVNIASSAGQVGNARQTHYATSKAAVIGLTKSLARELGPKGITVNAVPPGFVDTPALRVAEAAGELGPGVETHVPTTPVRRVGTPDDITAAVAYLVRDEASYVTGQIIGVNGGRTIV